MAQLTSCMLPSRRLPFTHPAPGGAAAVQQDLPAANCSLLTSMRRVRVTQNATDSSCQRMQRRQQTTYALVCVQSRSTQQDAFMQHDRVACSARVKQLRSQFDDIVRAGIAELKRCAAVGGFGDCQRR